MLVAVLDIGINNLTSVERAFSAPLGSKDSIVIVDQDKKEVRPDLLVLPGLGKFGAGMTALHSKNLVEKVLNWSSQGTKIVGICLGMQLLATSSDESPGVKGLNLISSRVVRLPEDEFERIPHIGWAGILNNSDVVNFPSLSSQGDFYFVHSFHLVPENRDNILTETSFGKLSFASSVISNNILGVQFHPEKSGAKGKSIVSEIIQWGRHES